MIRASEKNSTCNTNKPCSGKLNDSTGESPTASLPFIKTQDPQTLQELVNLEYLLKEKTTEFLDSVHDAIGCIQTKLNTIKSEVKDDFTMELRDADYYRVSMFQLEAKISHLKGHLRDELCSLIREEHEIFRELQGMDRRLEEWGKPLNSRIFRPIVNSGYRRNSLVNDEGPASEFQKFMVSSGGHTGGWEEQDHLLFLRERRKYNGKKKFFTSIQCLLPDLTEEQIVAHENWYQRYESLKQGQREAIRKWRAHKVAQKEQIMEPTRSDKEVAARNKQQKNIGYQRDIADRIKEWKRQQQIKKEEEEYIKKEEEKREQEERLRQTEVHNAKKALVEQYRAEKLNKLQTDLLAQQLKELQMLEERAKNSVLLRAFREQDHQYIEKKRYQKLTLALKEKQRAERLESTKSSIELNIERDPHRVFKPTQVWSHHCVKDDAPSTKPVLHLKTMPHLAVPSWRKGLSNI